MTTRFRILLATLLLTGTGATALVAQTVQDEAAAPSVSLNLPKTITTIGKVDPQVRKATAIVNGDVITGTDVDQRLALVILANGGRVSDEERDRLRVQVLRNLIDESLQIQEAKANEIKIDKAEVEQSFARVGANFKRTPEAFAKVIRDEHDSWKAVIQRAGIKAE